ncbi:NAD(P)/FAD-dependent oxidoreductase [Variovorax sp. YR566]|uniref:FAD/NAD(P)-dependent oxidoreductase n=1 Tax=Variovorax sp. YR566 TaxID=3450237 RepID=UPI003F7F35AF
MSTGVIATDIAVIGAGPAGLAAALAAAQAGARVDVIDAAALPGGQYWMQDPTGSMPATRQAHEGLKAIDACKALGVNFHVGTEVWAVFPDLRIGAHAADTVFEVAPRAIVVASGAHDRVMPFPGWTLPGVMTPGAGQRMIKLGGRSAGRSVALAGSGPFLLAVAETLKRHGEPPKIFVEARRPDRAMIAHLARRPARWAEAAKLLLAARTIPDRRLGWIVTEAMGANRLEAIRIAPISGSGIVEHGQSELIPDVDALLIGWGFRPIIEVTSLLQCRHDYDRDLGGWFCVTDLPTGRTSVANVYAAGEVTGIAGAVPARLSGEIAGASAAADLGFLGADATRARFQALSRLRSARQFALGLGQLFSPPSTLADLAYDDTIVCRCEEVCKREIRTALASSACTVSGVKRWTRAGMGRCQGRICGWAVAEIAQRDAASTPEESGFNSPRIPLRPVPLSAISSFGDQSL